MIKIHYALDKLDKMEEWLFSLPPSFYAIVSGALIGAATNLLTGLVFAPEGANVTMRLVKLAIFLIFLSSVCFCVISIILELLHTEVIGEDKATRKYNLHGELHEQRKILWPLFIGGLVSIGIGIIIVLN